MNKNNDEAFSNLPQQAVYAKILSWGVNFGLAFLLVAFGLYAFGILEPQSSFDLITHSWDLPLQEYLQKTGSPKGWDWVYLLDKGDYLNFAGVAWLALISGVCYLYLAFSFFKGKQKALFWVACTELFLIAVAAANVLHVGAH